MQRNTQRKQYKTDVKMSGNQEADESAKLLVRYKNETFDLTQFAHKHPGGRNTLSASINSDIDYKFETFMPHSQAAKYLLKEYHVSSQINNNNNNNDDNDQCSNDVDDNYNRHNKFDSDILTKENGYDEMYNNKSDGRDNSAEHLIETDDSMEVIQLCAQSQVSFFLCNYFILHSQAIKRKENERRIRKKNRCSVSLWRHCESICVRNTAAILRTIENFIQCIYAN